MQSFHKSLLEAIELAGAAEAARMAALFAVTKEKIEEIQSNYKPSEGYKIKGYLLVARESSFLDVGIHDMKALRLMMELLETEVHTSTWVVDKMFYVMPRVEFDMMYIKPIKWDDDDPKQYHYKWTSPRNML